MEPVPDQNLDPPDPVPAQCCRCLKALTEDNRRDCRGCGENVICRDCYEDGENVNREYCPACTRRKNGIFFAKCAEIVREHARVVRAGAGGKHTDPATGESTPPISNPDPR